MVLAVQGPAHRAGAGGAAPAQGAGEGRAAAVAAPGARGQGEREAAREGGARSGARGHAAQRQPHGHGGPAGEALQKSYTVISTVILVIGSVIIGWSQSVSYRQKQSSPQDCIAWGMRTLSCAPLRKAAFKSCSQQSHRSSHGCRKPCLHGHHLQCNMWQSCHADTPLAGIAAYGASLLSRMAENVKADIGRKGRPESSFSLLYRC